MAIVGYDNFDLLILPAGDRFQARVVNSGAGEAMTEFTLPFASDELRGFFWLSGRATRQIRLAPAGPAPAPLDTQQFGSRLFDAVFGGAVGQLLLVCLVQARSGGKGLRLRLRLNDVPALADLPWEYLHASMPRPGFLALSDETPVVRYLELPQQQQPTLRVRPPLRILAVISNPHGVPPLAVEKEWVRLHDALADLQSRRLVVLERLQRATVGALQERLRVGQSDVHILHFIGHGSFDPDANRGGFSLEDEAGDHHLVAAGTLGMVLRDHAALRMVFLNACEGARGSQQDTFAGSAQMLVQQGIPAVLAMQFEVGDDAAVALAQAFYRALAEGLPVDTATGEARKAVKAAGNDLEWGTPVLFTRSPDNRVLELAQGDARATIATGAFEPETVLIPGGSFVMGSAPGEGVPVEETPAHTLHLPDYRIGKYPVTIRQYAAFLRAEKRDPPRSKHWFGLEPKDRFEHPVTSVSWQDAVAYCAWLSKATGRRYRLPTEAEWEKAARGPTGRRYPWGDDWIDGRCNVGGDDTTPVDKYTAGASLAPPGSPDGVYGCLDLLGNVQEWTSTLWGGDRKINSYPYPYRPVDGRENPNVDQKLFRDYRIHRGGSFTDKPAQPGAVPAVRAARRGVADPKSAVEWRGFRVMMELN